MSKETNFMKRRVWTMAGVAILIGGTSSLALAQYLQPGYGQAPYGQQAMVSLLHRANRAPPGIRLSKDAGSLSKDMAFLRKDMVAPLSKDTVSQPLPATPLPARRQVRRPAKRSGEERPAQL
jgi:hypothetical protein